VGKEEFERLAEEALGHIPKKYLRYFRNVTIRVEDYPDDDVLESTGFWKYELLGLFTGAGHSSGGFFEIPAPGPDTIILYQKNIEDICASREQLLKEIRVTLIHEVGHYFGMSDDELAQYE